MALAYRNPSSYRNALYYQGEPNPGPSAYAVFIPPVVNIIPPYLPTTTGPALGLFRHYKRRDEGVAVLLLSDGSYVQTYATPENSNTSIPYPLDFYDIGAPYATVYSYKGVRTDYTMNPHVVKIYYGGHNNPITQAESVALTAAGYGDYIFPE